MNGMNTAVVYISILLGLYIVVTPYLKIPGSGVLLTQQLINRWV